MGCGSSKKPQDSIHVSPDVRHPEIVRQPQRVTQNAVVAQTVPEVTAESMESGYETPPVQVHPTQEPGIFTHIYTLQLPVERNACNITDSVETPDGHLVLCDQRNGKLYLYDEDFQFKCDATLNGLPYKVTDIPWRPNTIAVTVLNTNEIRYIQINHGILGYGETALKTVSKCRGIDCTSNILVYVMDTMITLQDTENKVSNMEHDFGNPVAMVIDRKSDCVYTLCETDRGYARLIKVTLDGNGREFDVIHPDIKSPVSLCCDRSGFVYICCRDPPSIYRLSSKGDNLGSILKAQIGLLQHLQYCKFNDIFVLTKPNTNKIWLYRFE